MQTSGETAFPNTARDVVTQAMRQARILPSGASAKASEMSDAIYEINLILKGWQSRDVSLWRETSGTLTIPANDPSGALPAYVRDVLSARYVFSATSERPMHKIERDEYMILPNKAQSGPPLMFYVSRQRDAAAIYVWPVPTAISTLRIEYDRIVETVTDPTQAIDLPSEYIPALTKVLAVRLSYEYGVDPSPILLRDADDLERQMFDADRPESYIMEAA